MKRSIQRILTTHAGSLHRPDDLAAMIFGLEDGRPIDRGKLAARVRQAVAEVVQQQVRVGIDVVSDGEMSKPSFVTYVKYRLSGFGGEVPDQRLRPSDIRAFSGLQERLAERSGSAHVHRAACDGPVEYVGEAELQQDVANLRAAVDGADAEEAFMTAISPGMVDQVMGNTHYATREEFTFAVAAAMRTEYAAIVDAGFVLQVDCPDLAMDRHVSFADATIEEFRRVSRMRIDALNQALEGLPADRVRVHVCWGNYPGPHHRDVALAEIIDLLLTIRCGALYLEGANPRHAHEWKLFESLDLPADKLVIHGVVDPKNIHIEHPEVVAQRIERLAGLIGRENVLAAPDCGFGTFVGSSPLVTEIADAKLAAMSEGAKLASQRLWP